MWQWNFARSYILIKAFKNGLNQFYSIFSSSNIAFKYVIPTVTLKNSWLLNDRGVGRQNGRPCTVWTLNQVSGDVIFDAFLLLAIVLSSPKLFIGSHSPPSCCVSYHICMISEVFWHSNLVYGLGIKILRTPLNTKNPFLDKGYRLKNV